MQNDYLRQNRQTLNLGIMKVARDLFPGYDLKMAYSIPQGVYCTLSGSMMSEREVDLFQKKLREWAEADSMIEFMQKSKGYYRYQLENTIVKSIYPANTLTSAIGPFRIVPFNGGFIVQFGEFDERQKRPLIYPQKLSATYAKTQKWLHNIKIELVSDVNEYIEENRGGELIGMAEALQEKEISDIADMIIGHCRSVRAVLISGPSSSGKTSFAQRLSTQLRVLGLKPRPLSLDNYYLDRDKMKKEADGSIDYESIDALDLSLLKEHISRLVGGETVSPPVFDFKAGKRSGELAPMRLNPSDILVIEGIHALNPGLLPAFDQNMFFKIYISALFELNVDLANRIPTTEVRLIRRLVRDELFRGTPADDTFARWASVRKGEYEYIFKYQEEADMMFNSSLIYELSAMRPFAEAALAKMPDDSPHFLMKERIENLLSFARPMDASKVPFNSILREFIGGSLYF
jgi:uridine kinase